MTTPARARYAGYRFPAEIISHAVWLFRCPLGLRMVEKLLAERGIIVSHETVRYESASNRDPPRFQSICLNWRLESSLGGVPIGADSRPRHEGK
jgi:transposase-like protein